MMKERTLRVLEFTRIREMLAEGALTEAGAEKCRALEPYCDLPEAAAITVHLYLPDGREETRQISYNGRESLIRFSGK